MCVYITGALSSLSTPIAVLTAADYINLKQIMSLNIAQAHSSIRLVMYGDIMKVCMYSTHLITLMTLITLWHL